MLIETKILIDEIERRVAVLEAMANRHAIAYVDAHRDRDRVEALTYGARKYELVDFAKFLTDKNE